LCAAALSGEAIIIEKRIMRGFITIIAEDGYYDLGIAQIASIRSCAGKATIRMGNGQVFYAVETIEEIRARIEDAAPRAAEGEAAAAPKSDKPPAAKRRG